MSLLSATTTRIVGKDAGTMKVVLVDATNDRILGVALLSYDSHEVINTVAPARIQPTAWGAVARAPVTRLA